jgi:hypothetical protein
MSGKLYTSLQGRVVTQQHTTCYSVSYRNSVATLVTVTMAALQATGMTLLATGMALPATRLTLPATVSAKKNAHFFKLVAELCQFLGGS